MMIINNNKGLMLFTLTCIFFISGCSQNIRHAPQRQSSTPVQQNQAEDHSTQRQQHSPTQWNQTSFGTRNKMVAAAQQSLGVRYRYGGTTPRSGFDCSGLMSYAHSQAGIKIPRTARAQREHSRTISYAQLQPGDMLFFKTGRRTEHVGIYIGDRKFIHASTGSRKVRVAKMDSAYWYKRFLKFGTYL